MNNVHWSSSLLLKGFLLSALSNLVLYGCVLALSRDYNTAIVVWIQGGITLFVLVKIEQAEKKGRR